MDNYFKFAIGKLQQSGLKITGPRSMVVELLAASRKALSPYEMRDLLKRKKIKADVVTIYRVLEMLEKLGLVHKVLAFNGYIACDTPKNSEDLCHHYLLCQFCHRVDEVKGENLDNLEKKIANNYQFKIESHYLEFMGICHDCSVAGKV